ncbi:MAG: hypothetical protein QME47_06920, partial [Candidatus Thermoplasmatota archaeon]|nr:hypothetical protein [Candidatus Thermoplasmatota archaeon]
EFFSHVESKFAGMKFWKGLRERTKLDYLNRHLSYLKKHELAKIEGNKWSIVPGIRAGFVDIFGKRKEVKKEAAEKKKKLPKIKLSALTKVDYLKRRPIYREVLDNVVALCSEKPMKRRELLPELEKRLATTAWAGYSLTSKKNYLTDHLRYLKGKGTLKFENLRWSAAAEASAAVK